MSKCIQCGGAKFQKLYLNTNWQVVKCTTCGLVRTEIGEKLNYQSYHRDEDYHKFEKQFKNIFVKRLLLIHRCISSGDFVGRRVLDIGASTGAMLDLFKEEGWETWGVEPSKSSVVAVSKGHKILNKEFEKANLPKDFFDAVIINHTLEHVNNPLIVLQKAKTLLKEGGIILVDVPNFGSLSSRLLGSRWPYLTPEEHLFHFTRETLSRLTEEAGLKVVYSESRSGLWDYGNPVKELFEAAFALKKRFFKELMNAPYSFLVTRLNMGEALTVIAQK